MKVYIKFIILSFLKSLMLVSIIFFSLVFILNTLTEVEFFSEIKVKPYFPIYISLLNTPSLLFEMFPFIFLISTQFFFITIFNSNQIQIFKYSGLKNSKILRILSITSFFTGIIIVSLFYSLSSNLKNIYLEIKNKYTTDDKYLAVITNNGLWIKDSYYDDITNIIHASNIEDHFLSNNFITQFDADYNVVRYIYSKKIDIKKNSWNIFNPTIYENGITLKKDFIKIQSNFNHEKIQSLFSNLSSLSIMELFILKKNYESLNYSITEVDLQIQKILSYPFYLFLMTILSSIIMFNTRSFRSNTLKISVGLFLSVIIYYIYNFFLVMGKTEKLTIILAVWFPLFLLFITNTIISYKINEK